MNKLEVARPPQAAADLWEQWLGIWNGHYDNASQILADDVMLHLPRYGMPDPASIPDRARLVAWIDAFRSSYTDVRFCTVLGPFTDDGHLIGRWRFMGHWQSGRPEGTTAAPGTPVEQHGVDILRLDAAGRIAEYWLSDDLLDVYVQLGAPLPALRTAPAE